MTENNQHTTRMTGIDQIVWNLTNDQDLFCIWAFATLEEPLKDDLVEMSLKYLIQTIPVLNSRPVLNWLNGYWQFIEKKNVKDLIMRINTGSDAEAKEYLNNIFLNPVNAKAFSMIRLFSVDGPQKHYFVIQVHHLVVDGEGLKRICVRFAQIYQELYRDRNWKPSGISDPCRSWWQIAKHFSGRHLWLMLKTYVLNIRQIVIAKLLNRVSYNLKGDVDINEKTDCQSHPYFESIQIEQESMRKLKAFTKRKHVTVNDVFMSSLSLAVMEWNMEHGDDREWLKYGFTANLRRWWGEPSGTFGNFSAVLIHEETVDNLKMPPVALAATKSKIDRLKKGVGLDAFLILMQLKFIPYFIIRRVSLKYREKLFEFVKKSHAMTNIGIVFKEAGDFGHTRATGYSFLAPTFPGGCIIYTITTYHNLTTIYLGCSEDYLTKASAKSFLLLWKKKILEVIAAD